ncbi:CHAT domain-containing protein [Streptomyces sp. NPDC059866]|uniref:CHAT domain-containing protein n=1 Tax=Streptomyces sp. NPDC059866 TaxID=3346978 RepID=UPI00365B8589
MERTLQVTAECPRCRREMMLELRVIRNLAREPELVSEIRQGTVFTFVCGYCHTEVEVAHGLLVYHPAHLPVMLFVPPPGVDRHEAQWLAGDLARVVRAEEGLTEPPHIGSGDLSAITPVVERWMSDTAPGVTDGALSSDEDAGPEPDQSTPGDDFQGLLADIRRRLASAAGHTQRITAAETAIAELTSAYGQHDVAADQTIERLLPMLQDMRVLYILSRIEELIDPESGVRRERVQEALMLATALDEEAEGTHQAKARVYRAAAEFQLGLLSGARDHTAAIHLAEQAVTVLRTSGDDQWLAIGLNSLARIHHQQHFNDDTGRHVEESVVLLNEALERAPADRPVLRAGILINLEMAYDDRLEGDPAENDARSLRCADAALTLVDRDHHPHLRALVHNNRGMHYLRSEHGDRFANIERAKKEFEDASTMLRADTAPTEWATLQKNLGVCLQQRAAGNRADNLEQALTHFGNALSVTGPQDDSPTWIQAQLGYAVCLMERRVEPVEQFESQAVAMIDELLAHTTETGDERVSAECHYHLGTLYAGKTDRGAPEYAERAIEHLTKASTHFTRERDPLFWGVIHSQISLVRAKAVVPDVTAAIADAESAITAIDRNIHPFEWGVAHLNLAVVHQLSGDPDRAIVHANLALETLTPDNAPHYCVRTAGIVGECHAAAGRWPQAAEGYATAAGALAVTYDEAVSGSGRTAVLDRASAVYTSYTFALARCGNLSSAVESAEAGRSFALREALALDPTTVDADIDRTTAEYRDYQDAFAKLRAAEAAVLGPRPTHARVTAQQARVADEHRRAELEAARHETARARALLIRPRRADFDAICAYATGNDALCYLLTSPWGTSLLTVLPTEGRVEEHSDPLTHEALAALVFPTRKDKDGERSGLLLGTMSGGDTAQHAIRTFASAPVTSWLRDRLRGRPRVTVVPMGWWSLVPLSIVVPDSTALTHAASAEILHRCQVRARAYAQRAAGVLAYAEPSLPLARPEVEAVLAVFDDGTAVPAQPGAKDELAAHIEGFNHLHLATHGVYRLQEPMESSILVGSQPLFIRELITHQVLKGVRLAFLSACQSGVTDILTRRDEVIGLPSACIQSGASGVVATLWPVDDAATFLFVRKFYTAYAASAGDPAKALAIARTHLRELTAGEILEELQELPPSLGSLRLRRRGYTPFSDPVFWAPFVFFGA